MSELVPITVTRGYWSARPGGNRTQALRIFNGQAFIIIPINQARQVVDDVHDAVDEYENRLRNNQSTRG